jgi:hypothetical protein
MSTIAETNRRTGVNLDETEQVGDLHDQDHEADPILFRRIGHVGEDGCGSPVETLGREPASCGSGLNEELATNLDNIRFKW